MRQFILHVGGHKTGSSAMQVWFKNNADFLHSHNIAFPAGMTNASGNCRGLTDALINPPKFWSLGSYAMKALFIGFVKENPGNDILVSDENLNRPESLDGLANIASDVAKLGMPVKTVMFVRNQVDWLSSYYSQKVKLLDMTEPFSAAVQYLPNVDHADWNLRRLRHIELGFQPVFGVYGRKSRMPVVKSFLDVAGLLDRFPADTDFSVAQINPSVGEFGVLVGLHVARFCIENHVVTPRGGSGAFARCLLQTCAAIDDRPFVGPDQADRFAIRARFAKGNREMTHHLPEDEAEQLLTETLPTDYVSPRSPGDLSTYDLARLAEAMEICRSHMLAETSLHKYLPKRLIERIPRIS